MPETRKRIDVLVKLPFSFLGDKADRLVQRQLGIFLRGARVDLVVHVRDVAHVLDLVLAVAVTKQAVEHVEHDDWPRIADMGIVIDRRAADIEGHPLRVARRENTLLALQGVVKFPVRIKCAVLSWNTLTEALSQADA